MQNSDKQEPVFGLDIQVFMDVIDCGDALRRAKLARQIAAFLADPESPAGERAQVEPVAIRLASDEDIEVRQVFAEALRQVRDLPIDLLFAILADEEEVSLPFLAATRGLDAARMLAVLRTGDAAQQALVVSRGDLSPEAVDAVVCELPLDINMLLLENPEAQIAAPHYQTLYERFGHDRDMLHLLLARPDLPAVIRLVQARRAAANLSYMLTRRGWVPGGSARELVQDAEETATLGVLVAATADELPEAVSFLLDNEYLTPSLIVHAACKGAMDIVAQCLSTLSGIPLRRTEEQMFTRGKFKGLFGRSGLPQSCYWTLQAACDTARDEREDGAWLTADEFGHRLVETLMTRCGAMPIAEQPRQLTYIARFATESTRELASRLKDTLKRAA